MQSLAPMAAKQAMQACGPAAHEATHAATEAAHLMPFQRSHPDDLTAPLNGSALLPRRTVCAWVGSLMVVSPSRFHASCKMLCADGATLQLMQTAAQRLSQIDRRRPPIRLHARRQCVQSSFDAPTLLRIGSALTPRNTGWDWAGSRMAGTLRGEALRGVRRRLAFCADITPSLSSCALCRPSPE